MKSRIFTAVVTFSAAALLSPIAHAEADFLAVKESVAAIESVREEAAQANAANVDTTTTASIAATSAGAAKAASVTNARYSPLVAKYAAKHGLPDALVHAVIQVESNYRANATGRAGEVGLMQIKPATARMMGYSGSTKGLYDPETNIRFGLRYLAKAQKVGDGTTCGTILKYNAGHGARRMNPISANYCTKVKRIMGVT